MRVLDVASIFPYPVLDGHTLPIFSFLRCLARRGVRYTLVAPVPPRIEDWRDGLRVFDQLGIEVRGVSCPPARGLKQAWRCVAAGRPWVNRAFHPELLRAATSAVTEGDWDIIQAETILGGQHLPLHLPAPSVLIATDCLSAGYHGEIWRVKRSPKELINKHKIAWMERSILRRFDRVLAISEPDVEALRALAPGTRVDVLRAGVNLDQFQPADDAAEEEGLVVFTGAMDFAPNIDAMEWFAGEVWPAVRRACPQARLAIVGRDPVDAIRALGERDASITVTGRVPHIEEWMARASVIVAPIRFGSGMKNKVLEGAAVARAMVSTAKGIENIELEPGRDVLLADTAEDFAGAVVRLLGDRELRRSLGRSARRVVEERYDRDAQAETLWRVYQELAGGPANAAP